ncbi:MAG: hypothetical protein ACRCUT_07830 [Spirochaetota bacterium]
MSMLHMSYRDASRIDIEEGLRLAGMHMDEQINEDMFRCRVAGIDVEKIPRYKAYLDRKRAKISPATVSKEEVDEMAAAFAAVMRGEGEGDDIGRIRSK